MYYSKLAYAEEKYVKANIEAKIITEKNSVTCASFTGPSLNRIRAILFPGYATFCFRLSWRENVPYTRTMGTRWSNVSGPVHVRTVEYVWRSVINLPRMDVSSSNIFRVTYRATTPSFLRENTRTSPYFIQDDNKNSFVSPLLCRILTFDQDYFHLARIPISTYFLVNRDNSTWRLWWPSGQIAVSGTLIAPDSQLKASRRRKLVSKRFLMTRLHRDLVNFDYLLSIFPLALSLSFTCTILKTLSHVPEIIVALVFHSCKLYQRM